MAGILAFEQALRRGGFSEGGKGSSAGDYREYWMRETNNVYAWVQERIEEGLLIKDGNGVITLKDAYEDYVEWCKDREEEAVSKKAFGMRMEQLGYRRVDTGKRRARGYAGLRWAQSEKNSKVFG